MRKNIAFFISHFMGTERFSYSMGTAYMAAYLKEKGVGTTSFSGCSKDLINFLKKIKKNDIKIVGIPTYDLLFSHARVIAHETRQMLPDVLIIAGGPTATFADEIVLKNIPEIDIAVRGEGEETIYELYQYAKGLKSLDEINGISFRDGKKIIRNPDRSLIGLGEKKGAELDILPSPYATGIISGVEKNIGLQTSRGCIYPCIFCCGPGMFKGKVRYHSIDRVISDLKIISEHLNRHTEFSRVEFWDDNFCLDLKRTRRLCEAIINEGLDLKFHAQVRADRLNRDLLILMYEAGIRGLNFGLESAVPEILRNIKKVGGKSPDLEEEKEYIESIRKRVEDCKKIGIEPVVSVMFGSPGETYEQGMATLKMIKELNLNTYYHSYFTIFVGTEAYKERDRLGIKMRKGDKILPLKHKYPYDVTKIPVLPNAYPVGYSLAFVQTVENSLFGWWDNINPFLKFCKPHFILEDRDQLSEDLLRWLKENMNFFSQVIFRYDKTRPTRKNMKKAKKDFRENLLARSFIVLERSPVDLPGGIKHYRLKTDELEKFPLYCPSYYFAYSFHKAKNSRRTSSSTRTVFYEITSRRDVKDFIENITSSSGDIEKSIISKMLRDDILLSSACRFTGNQCPALKLQKIHVRKNGELGTCENGEPIGVIGDSLDVLKSRLEKLAEKTEKERGCASCPVKDYCARCLFPAPFTADEYCNFMRNTRWLPRILRFLLICYSKRYKEIFMSRLRQGEILES
ncbi:MAG: B12-binding domain-containing radical SAM protein [Candidatus Eremiobacteraeota bacterium]|nr:B12-binding domain-containing radical SAM protein [Candidatus Eremiobacteraeota bacterium]